MTGHLYSRIGTPALEEKCPDPAIYENKFYDEILYDKSAWLSADRNRRKPELGGDFDTSYLCGPRVAPGCAMRRLTAEIVAVLTRKGPVVHQND